MNLISLQLAVIGHDTLIPVSLSGRSYNNVQRLDHRTYFATPFSVQIFQWIWKWLARASKDVHWQREAYTNLAKKCIRYDILEMHAMKICEMSKCVLLVPLNSLSFSTLSSFCFIIPPKNVQTRNSKLWGDLKPCKLPREVPLHFWVRDSNLRGVLHVWENMKAGTKVLLQC